jgi:hypothetical protein
MGGGWGGGGVERFALIAGLPGGFYLITAGWPGVARLLVTFFVNATKKVTKENAPRHPRNPGNRACRVGGKELALLGCF